MSKRTFSIVLVTILAVLSVLIVSNSNNSASARPFRDTTIKEWPAFTMTYMLTSKQQSQTVLVEYKNATNWRVEILAEPSYPDIAGYWAEYNGSEIRSFDPLTGEISVNTDVPTDGVYIPEQWLGPYYVPKYLAQSNVQVTVVDEGVNKLTITEYVECQEELNDVYVQAGLNACASGETYLAVTEITYQAAYNIPLSIVETLDGIEIRRIVVTELNILDN